MEYLLISSFATILRRACCAKGDVCGRIAGDEFMGILRNTTEEEINAFAEALKAEQIALKNNPTNYAISVSYAMGYAFPRNIRTAV